MAHIQICEHIKDNGDTCGSPALTGYSFCYFHQRLRLPRHRPSDFEYKLPILDTPHAILMATQHITQAALDGILEERRARLVLSALRLAMTTLKAMNDNELKKNSLKKDQFLDAARPRAACAAQGTAMTTDLETKTDAGTAIVDVGTDLPVRPARAQLAILTDTEPPQPITAASTSAPVANAKKPPLSATQTKLMKKILRRGPSDPRFHTAARLLDHSISGGAS